MTLPNTHIYGRSRSPCEHVTRDDSRYSFFIASANWKFMPKISARQMVCECWLRACVRWYSQHQYSHLMNNSYSFRWFFHFRLLLSVVYGIMSNFANRLLAAAAAAACYWKRLQSKFVDDKNAMHFWLSGLLLQRTLSAIQQFMPFSVHALSLYSVIWRVRAPVTSCDSIARSIDEHRTIAPFQKQHSN